MIPLYPSFQPKNLETKFPSSKKISAEVDSTISVTKMARHDSWAFCSSLERDLKQFYKTKSWETDLEVTHLA